jgi:hypothetical protein
MRFILFLTLLLLCFTGISAQEEFYRFNKTGTVSEINDIFNPDTGTLSVWINFDEMPDSDYVLFYTDDSAFVLVVDTYESPSLLTTVHRIGMRAGAIPDENDYYPETSIIINNDGKLDNYAHSTYQPRPFSIGEWHLVTATWEDTPSRLVKIYLDGEFIAQRKYTWEKTPKALHIGYNVVSPTIPESATTPPAIFSEGIVQLADMRLYDRPLSLDEIVKLAATGVPELEISVISE